MEIIGGNWQLEARPATFARWIQITAITGAATGGQGAVVAGAGDGRMGKYAPSTVSHCETVLPELLPLPSGSLHRSIVLLGFRWPGPVERMRTTIRWTRSSGSGRAFSVLGLPGRIPNQIPDAVFNKLFAQLAAP